MEPLGPQLRRQRRRLALTLDELATITHISKPYLSLIETGRVLNPPSDEKLKRLEQALRFPPGRLVTQAHLHRTPRDVRAVLQHLMNQKNPPINGNSPDGKPLNGNSPDAPQANHGTPAPRSGKRAISKCGNDKRASVGGGGGAPSVAAALPVNLDDAYLSGVLQQLVDHAATNIERIPTNAVPIINRVSAGYPRDFTDLSYPRGIADSYVSCPDLPDPDAFAARVFGDSMTPKYREGDIVIFSPAASCKNGDDCFVRFDDAQTTFKRIFFESADDNAEMIRLQPRNEKYRPRTLPREQITGLYKAVFKMQRIDNG